jgi:hypothetical protein
MHPEIFDAFETVCAPLDVTGGVLEIGVSPDHRSLLDLPCLARASERVGVGLEAAFAGPEGRYRVLKMRVVLPLERVASPTTPQCGQVVPFGQSLAST